MVGFREHTANEEVNAVAENRQRQAGDGLIGLEGHRQNRINQRRQRRGGKSSQQGHDQAVGITAHTITADGADGHHPFDTEIQIPGALGNDFAGGGEEQRRTHADRVIKEADKHIHLCVLPSFFRGREGNLIADKEIRRQNRKKDHAF